MRPIIILAICLGIVFQEFGLAAQVPHILTYQGRVASGGTDFNGVGQFKFALVSGATSTAAQATASATVSFGFLVQITVTSGGAGYAAAPVVTITDSSGSGASAVAQIANGQVVGITVTDAGSGYTASPTIMIAPPAMNLSYATYWSHDGTSSAGGEPASVVPVSVSQGLFTVGLGDTMIPNMSTLAPQVFANSDVRLRIWFNDGVNGFHQLSPDQRLTSTAYAMMADTVRDGAITAAKLAPNSVTSAQIAPGSITVSQLADGVVTRAKLATDVNLETPPGAIALSTNANDTNLISRGYIRAPNGRVVRDEWSLKPSPPVLRYFEPNVMVWTGNEVVSFGEGQPLEGGQSQFFGERFNPSNNVRRVVSTSGAPAFPRNWQPLGSAPTWTGVEVILLGSTNGVAGFRSTLSGRYNPAADSWRSFTVPSNLSSNINSASVFWTGRELIFWAGAYYGGAMYRPDLGAWSPISSSGAPPAPAPAVWTGSDMIVFGSGGAASGKFNPRSNVWETISEIGAPNLESISDAVWTGSEAIVIGEIGSKPSGAVFNPTVNSWRSMDSLGLYLFRDRSWAPPVWTGSAMVLIGANPILKATLYDPRSNSWTIPGSLSPFDCFDCGISASVWTGSELLYHIPRDGFYYGFSPALELYLYQKQ